MSKNYQRLLKLLGITALVALLVAAVMYFNGHRTNARIALGFCMSVSGIALILYSLRQ
ncbi:MAG TPA: hypothetical protein V6C85_15680 [Allocoleopsis sp.]